jgi:phenylacetate-CoA ligase
LAGRRDLDNGKALVSLFARAIFAGKRMRAANGLPVAAPATPAGSIEQRFNPNVEEALLEMLAHAAAHSPFYRDKAWAKSLRGGARMALKNIPVTKKDVVREQSDRFFADGVEPSEGKVASKATSGSTGEPMVTKMTQRFLALNKVENARLTAGWGIEHHPRAVSMKNPNADHPPGAVEEKPEGRRRKWTLYTVDSREGFELIRKTGASLLYSHPSKALAMLQHGEDIGVRLPLKLIVTISEIVPEQLRLLVAALPGCRMVDRYGCIETGLIAAQCAQCGAYHPAERHMVVEILDDANRPVRSGKMGKVVVTPLFNRAMPLIRYETGDYAVVAETHTCPRSSASLAQISGREKNLFTLPDGRKIVPGLGPHLMLDLDVRHFKLIQRTLTDVEFHYLPKDPASEVSRERIQGLVDRFIAPGFSVTCVKVSELPRAASGKFLMHESMI